MCSLWAHKNCVKMSDAAFKALDIQQKETGVAYWVCRPCQSFAQRIQHQLGENNKRHEDTERKVDENSRKINENTAEINKLKEEMKKMAERVDRDRNVRDDKLYDEMQEREVRRLNLVLHGLAEAPEQVRVNRDRQEADRAKCEEVFEAMRANMKKEDIRFCRRLGEKSSVARPLIIGLENEEKKRHILTRARNLKGTRFEEVSVVPDLTRKQREIEDRMRQEAEDRNKKLTSEDLNNNLRWIVVGRRGEKRLIKGFERQDINRGQARNLGLAGGDEWWGSDPRPQPHTLDQYLPTVPQPAAGGHRGGGQAGHSASGPRGGYNNGNRGGQYTYQNTGQQNNYQPSGSNTYGGYNNGQQDGHDGQRQQGAENWRERESFQQETSRMSNERTFNNPETYLRARLPSNKRTREHDQEMDHEPARNRGRH